jgi:hypothetical protein
MDVTGNGSDISCCQKSRAMYQCPPKISGIMADESTVGAKWSVESMQERTITENEEKALPMIYARLPNKHSPYSVGSFSKHNRT